MKKILLVDDDPEMLDLLHDRLEAEHFEIIMAANGKECIQQAQDQQPHLILTDLMMPGMNGGECIRCLKESTLTKDIPIVFLTAAVTRGEDKKINVDGVWYSVVAKPFEAKTLLDAINKHVR